jgi:YVTN family beta-propeller protein
VTISRDGARAYVTNGYSDTVSAINTATHTVIATLPTGNSPFEMLISPNGKKLYVTNSSDTTVTVIDIPSLTVSATITDVGSAPFEVVVGP